MDSKPGLYRHVLVLDFKSLYPSIIRTFCIDPMGLIEGLQHPEHAIAGFRGAMFSRERHFLPDLIATLWAARDRAKAASNKALSQAIKIIMNSFYGVLGSGAAASMTRGLPPPSPCAVTASCSRPGSGSKGRASR